MTPFPKIAIIYLSYHSEADLPAALVAWQKLTYPRECLRLVIVDNPHPQFGLSEKIIRELVLPHSGRELPETVYLPQERNLGFAGGNNVGIKWALEHGCDYVFLHNQDGFLEKDCLIKMIEVMEKDKTIGCAQSLVMLYPDTNKVNTAGNSYHYLGYGFINHFGVDRSKLNLQPVEQVGYATGSSLLLRADLIKKYGPLDEDLFAYHEDVEYSFRLKLLGYKVVSINDAIFYHKYVFSRHPSKFYYMERNRFALLMMYFRFPTLIFILPMLVVMEFGMIYFFIRNGWYKEKLGIYKYWLKRENWKLWLGKRKKIQNLRVQTDRQFLSGASGMVHFGEKEDMNSPLLIYIANPVLFVYGWLLKKIIFW